MSNQREKDWLIKLITSKKNYAKTRARLGKDVVSTQDLSFQYQLGHPEAFCNLESEKES